MAPLGDLLAQSRDVLATRLLDARVSKQRVSRFLDDLAERLSSTGSADLSHMRGPREGDGPVTDDALAAAGAFARLHGLVLEVAAENSVEVTLSEHAIVATCVRSAIGELAGRAPSGAPPEMHRLAHKIRNPLGSALMAVTLLRAKVNLGDGERLAEMLERNLKRVEAILDSAVEAGSTCEPADGSPLGAHQR
jgi:nitrogen-specific signal transduction histidine kinase